MVTFYFVDITLWSNDVLGGVPAPRETNFFSQPEVPKELTFVSPSINDDNYYYYYIC